MFVTYGFHGGGFMLSFGGHGMGSSRSRVGEEFDEYVKHAVDEPFPYNPMTPVVRDIEDLWRDRRFRIFSCSEQSREGKVVSWKQWNSGPYSPCTHWSLIVEMDGPLREGDRVRVKTRSRDTVGFITECLADNKYKIRPVAGSKVITAKQEQLTAQSYYGVRCMNVEGGGTLVNANTDDREDGKELLSLQWIEPAIPSLESLHLYDDVISARCPTCRASETPQQAFDDDVSTTNNACPICLETKLCRTLQCGHHFCQGCWKQWVSHAFSKIPSSVTEPDILPKTLQQARDRDYQRHKAQLPHIFGGTATRTSRLRSNKAKVDEVMENYVGNFIHSFMVSLDRDADGPFDDIGDHQVEQGLPRFWTKLRKCSIHLFLLFDNALAILLGDLYSMAAIEIMIRVAEERAPEIIAGMQHFKENGGGHPGIGMSEEAAKGFVHEIIARCCNRMGERHERNSDYRSAIHWYDRAVMHAKKQLDLVQDEIPLTVYNAERHLSMRYTNLGLAQKRAGMLSKAMESYNLAWELCQLDQTENNKEMLSREMEHWTGSSGVLTPGC